MRPVVLFGILAAALWVEVAADPRPAQGIEISADVPTVSVNPRRADRLAVRLPGLTYALTLTPNCDENWQPASVSINIADSRMSLDAKQLQNSGGLKVELKVPSNQIAPLRIERFCINDRQETIQADDNEITIAAALSVQASLLCTLESEQSITYVTKPLDVTLECAAPELAAD